MNRRFLYLSSLALALPGCWIYSEDAEPEESSAAGGGTLAAGAAAGGGETGGAMTAPTCVERRATYPAGPYGTGEDDRITNLGFLDPAGAPVNLQSLRADCTYKLAVVTTSAGWCGACREEQPKLQALFEDYSARGVLLLVTLFEDDNYDPAVPRLALDWREHYELTFPVLADPEFLFRDYYDPAQTPMVMLLDLETMQIEDVTNGYVDADVRSLVDTLL